MSKKANKNRNPVYIPNQSLFNNRGYLYFVNEGTVKEHNKENEIQKKLSLRNK